MGEIGCLMELSVTEIPVCFFLFFFFMKLYATCAMDT